MTIADRWWSVFFRVLGNLGTGRINACEGNGPRWLNVHKFGHHPRGEEESSEYKVEEANINHTSEHRNKAVHLNEFFQTIIIDHWSAEK